MFVEQLRSHQQPLAGFLVNRCLVPAGSPGAPEFAPRADLPEWDAAVGAVGQLYEQHLAKVALQEANIAELAAGTTAPVWRIPDLGEAVHDLDGITALSHYLRAAVA